MSFSNGLRLTALVVAVVLGVSLWFAWKGARKEQAQLQAEVKATQQTLAEAKKRQSARDAALQKVIAALGGRRNGLRLGRWRLGRLGKSGCLYDHRD